MTSLFLCHHFSGEKSTQSFFSSSPTGDLLQQGFGGFYQAFASKPFFAQSFYGIAIDIYPEKRTTHLIENNIRWINSNYHEIPRQSIRWEIFDFVCRPQIPGKEEKPFFLKYRNVTTEKTDIHRSYTKNVHSWLMWLILLLRKFTWANPLMLRFFGLSLFLEMGDRNAICNIVVRIWQTYRYIFVLGAFKKYLVRFRNSEQSFEICWVFPKHSVYFRNS